MHPSEVRPLKPHDANPRVAHPSPFEAPADIESFVKRFEKPIFRYVLRLVGEDEAEDVTQDVFLKAIAGLPRFRGEASLETWLYRIATNTCRDHLRRRRWQRLLFIRKSNDAADLVSRSVAKPNPIEESEIRSLIRAALRELAPHHREVIVLRDIEGFSYEEIAAIVGCPIGTVKSRLYHARAQLAKKLRTLGLESGGTEGGDR